MNAHDSYQKGNLQEAIVAALEDVRRFPAVSGKRNFLCELLCFDGALERADRQLDAMGQQDADTMLSINLFKQLIHAELARQEFFTRGRLPDFLDGDITPDLSKHLEAAILLRDNKSGEAARVLAASEEQRPTVSGTCNDQPFDDLRDLDDLTASFFEVLTDTGKYYWIPFGRVESIKLQAPERPRDLLWRPAELVVRGGPADAVFLPVLYPGTASESDDQLRLGRATDWRQDPDAPIRGRGQRVFLVGNDDRTILELQHLRINPPKS
jgi:type VI secretion system protein ImpE